MVRDKNILDSISALARRMFGDGSGEVYLYGSRARGDSNANSDWDLLVLIDDSKFGEDVYEKFVFPYAELGWYTGDQITPVYYSRSQWEAERGTSFYNNLKSDAIRL